MGAARPFAGIDAAGAALEARHAGVRNLHFAWSFLHTIRAGPRGGVSE